MRLLLFLFAMLVGATLWADRGDVFPWRPPAYKERFTEAERAQPYVYGRSFPLYDWPFLDGQWEGILCDRDGFVWFAVSSHSWVNSGHLFRYDPKADKVQHVADLAQACGEALSESAPQDKVHSQMWEDGDVVYCATCEGHSSDTRPYRGGYWLSIDRKTGVVKAVKSPSEDGLITVAWDAPRRALYALTNVKGQLLRFDPATGEEKLLGVPWQDSPAKWKRDLSLMIAPDGVVYGCKPPNCTFWRYRPDTGKIDNLDVAVPLPADVAAGDAKAIEAYKKESGHLAMTRWDDKDQCFYAIRSHDEMLLRFTPPAGERPAKVEALRQLGLSDHRYGQRHASCMFVVVGRTLWYTPYTGWGGVTHLQSYRLDTGEFRDYGPVIVDGERRVNECHSIAAGADGRLFLVAFVFSVEGADPAREWAMRDKWPFHPRFVILDPAKDCKPGAAPAP